MKLLILLPAILLLSIPLHAQSQIEWERFLMAVPGSTASLFSRGITVAPDGTIWSAVNGRRVARSTDAGVTWDTTATGLHNQHYIQTVFVSRGGTIYAGGSRELLRSTNNGASFVVAAPTASNVEDMLETDDGLLYAAVPDGLGGIYRSSDSGESWQRLTLGDPPYYLGVSTIEIGSDGALLAGLGRGIFISRDGGSTFQVAADSSIVGIVMQIRLSPNGTLFATSHRGMWRSLDSGRTWQHRSPVEDMMLEMAINHDGVIFATTLGVGLYRSTDNGESWQTIHGERYPAETRSITRIALAPDGRLFGVASSGFIYRTVVPTVGVRSGGQAPEQIDLSDR